MGKVAKCGTFCRRSVTPMMMRTLVVATMLASASSFAPSPKTQLATRRPAQAPPRLKYIEDLKLRADKATTALGLFRSTALLTSVYALQYNNEGLRVAYAVVFVAAVTGAIKAESLANKGTREIQEANDKRDRDFFLVAYLCVLTGFACAKIVSHAS